jgi:hypothetical protein
MAKYEADLLYRYGIGGECCKACKEPTYDDQDGASMPRPYVMIEGVQTDVCCTHYGAIVAALREAGIDSWGYRRRV